MRHYRCATVVTILSAALMVVPTTAQPPERGRDARPDDESRRLGEFGGRPGLKPQAMMRAFPVMAALDADHDGIISKEEIDNATSALQSLDKNKDGALTIEEIRPDPRLMGNGRPPGDRGREREFGDREAMRGGPEGRREPGGENRPGRPGFGGPQGDRAEFMLRMFAERDANEDGKLDASEMPERLAERLDQIDTDSDGSVSREEIKAMMSRMQSGPGERAREGRSEGGGRSGGDRPQRPELQRPEPQ